MKRMLASIMALIMVLQLGFVVSANEEKIIYELIADDYKPGSDLSEGAYNLSDKATMRIEGEADGNYIAVRSQSSTSDTGFSKLFNFDGVKTVSFDYRTVPGSPSPALLYIDLVVSITLTKAPYYYDKGNFQMDGALEDGRWMNITLVTDAASKTFDVYTDGLCIAENIPTREGRALAGDHNLRIMAQNNKVANFDFKNLKVYDGEVVPPLTDYIKYTHVQPERTLVDYTDADARLDAALGNAVAMTVGNSVARVNNGYVNIDPDNEYVAPFITPDGYTLIPTRFTTETIGCEVEVLSSTSFRFSKDGTVMEINMGDKNAIINGQPVEMPTTPVIKNDRLFIPLRFAAETYGKNVFWDDRGLIIISDGEVVKAGQEDIIKPLISEIRNHTTIFGNKKYSDVNMSARQWRPDGFDGGQWGGLDAAKRFMATVNRWTYNITGNEAKAYKDQGILQQGTLNANAIGDYGKLGTEKNATAYFLGGTPYTRADGVNGTTWGCVNNPMFMEGIKERAKLGLDNGMFMWQFDDWPLTGYYRLGACHCKWCNDGFKEYLRNDATEEEIASLAAQGITDVSDFDYIKWLESQGITSYNNYNKVENTPIDKVRKNFYIKQAQKFHDELLSFMKEYSGSDIFYSVNMSNTLENAMNTQYAWIGDYVQGVMGETASTHTTADGIYATMLFTRGIGLENIISPLPKNEGAKNLMYSAIPMCYATGQFMLVPWDDWLYGSTRYYANTEELEGTFEFPREYPFLFDNYEIPESIGYVFDLNENSIIRQYCNNLLNKGIPARGLMHLGSDYTFTEDNIKGLQALIATGDLPNLTADERAAIENSGVMLISKDDTASIDWLENTYFTVRDNDADVYTVLRTNQLYDNAPVVVHAVNYDSEKIHENVEIELNNLWLPEGDTLTINVYKPGENSETIKAQKGAGTTKVTIDSVDRWTVLEICGPNTVRREVAFDLGEGVNGIGTGTRISKDKAFGTPDNFTIVTYSEGINSTTFNDTTGTQDEIAFVYKRLGNSAIKSTQVSAGFDGGDGAYGVMIREGIYSNARFVALVYDDANGLRLAHRELTNKAVIYTDAGKSKPAYMKLKHEGNDYVAYTSDDGKNYTEVGRITTSFGSLVGGVFATSPDGSRAECRVKDFLASEGNYPAEEFDTFKISCGNGVLEQTDQGKYLDMQLSTESYKNIDYNDVTITFKSSDENVVRVDDKGKLTPINGGSATITATARMGMKTINASTSIKVIGVDPQMFDEGFDVDGWPEWLTHTTAGNPEVKDGVLRAVSQKVGDECDMTFKFDQKPMPTVFEFDFKAHFGTTSPTTGTRVIYANGLHGMAMTADRNGFNWFFANAQTHIMPIEEDKWYHIKIEANYEEQYANVYIDGEKIIEKGQTRGGINPDGNIQVGGWRMGTDSCYEWDNFNFYFVGSVD